MTLTISVVCFIIAAVIFALAAWWTSPRGNLLAGGLFFLTVALLTAGVKLA